MGFADGPGNVAQFFHPSGIAVDVNGTVYVADVENNRVRKVAPDGTVSALMVEQDGTMREVEPAGMRIEYVSAA